MSINNCISFLGIIFDIMGAWYLSNGLMKKTLEEIRSQVVGGFFKYTIALGELKQKSETINGFLLLTIGFLLQGYSYVKEDIQNWIMWYELLLISIVLLVVIIAYCSYSYKVLVKRFVLHTIEIHSKNHPDYKTDADQSNRYLIELKKNDNTIKLFEEKYPNIKSLSEDIKNEADQEWHVVTEKLWGKLNVEIKEKFIEKIIYPKWLF